MIPDSSYLWLCMVLLFQHDSVQQPMNCDGIILSTDDNDDLKKRKYYFATHKECYIFLAQRMAERN